MAGFGRSYFIYDRVMDLCAQEYSKIISSRCCWVPASRKDESYYSSFRVPVQERDPGCVYREETITRINAHIADMESGVGVAPTRDQDLFAYRAEVQFRSVIAFLSTRYKLEIGDFPGEQTQAFVESENPWLHNTNYFQWAMGADAFIFVVDSEKAIANRDNYVAKQKSAFRAAWQRIQEHHIDGSIRLSRKPVILVYSKADKELGIFFTEKNVEKFQSELDEKFADLIDYFRQDAKRFQTVLISVVLENRSERLGIAKLASYVLPRSTYL
jgi:hypothetical protein